jgi:hypothetical protein
MQTALNLHRYFGEVDPLARRFLHILLAFNEAIARNTVSCAAPITSKSGEKDIFSAFFSVVHNDAEPGGIDNRHEPQTRSSGMEVSMPTSNSGWGNFPTQPGGVGFQPGMGQEMMQQIPAGSDLASTSPPDYLLDFDAFLTSVSRDPAYQQDLWMPLYGTMDIN